MLAKTPVIVLCLALVPACCKKKSGQGAPEPEPEEKTFGELAEEMKLPAGKKTEEGIAVALLIDGSGSMSDAVMDVDKVERSKMIIAKKTAKRILAQMEKFSRQNPDKKLQAGIYAFSDYEAKILFPMGEVKPEAAAPEIDGLSPYGYTPIGIAMVTAKKELNDSGLKDCHIIIVTDGENTWGYDPVDVVKAIKLLPDDQQPEIYFIAFDVNAEVFKDVTDQGISVVGAQNAAELQGALDYILYKKILAEQPI